MKLIISLIISVFCLAESICESSISEHEQKVFNSKQHCFRYVYYSSDDITCALAAKTSLKDLLIKEGFVVQVFQDDHLDFYDIENDKIGVVAKLSKNGVMEFAIQTKIIIEGEEINEYAGKGTRKGEDLFDFIFQHFSGKIKAIKGKWIPLFPSNLDTFNQSIEKRKWYFMNEYSVVDAVFRTWTGKMALKYGFQYFEFLNLEGESGAFSRVDLIFYKNPESVDGRTILTDEVFSYAA